MKKKVKVIRFKESGKYYDEMEIELPEGMISNPLYQIWDWLKEKRRWGSNASFYWLISIPDHPDDYPHLLLPKAK